MSKKVLVPIAFGTEEIEAATIIDVLRRAGADVTVASVGQLNIVASRGMNIVADVLINDCVEDVYDAIVLAGGLDGAEHFRDSEALIKMLKKQNAAGRLIAAICASPAIVLAEHSLIDDVKTTCYPSMQDKLPKPSNEIVVDDKNFITSQGPATAMPFALKVVENLFDKSKSDDLAKALLYKA